VPPEKKHDCGRPRHAQVTSFWAGAPRPRPQTFRSIIARPDDQVIELFCELGPEMDEDVGEGSRLFSQPRTCIAQAAAPRRCGNRDHVEHLGPGRRPPDFSTRRPVNVIKFYKNVACLFALQMVSYSRHDMRTVAGDRPADHLIALGEDSPRARASTCAMWADGITTHPLAVGRQMSNGMKLASASRIVT